MRVSSEEHNIIVKLRGGDYEHPFKWDPRTMMKIIPSAGEVLARVTNKLDTEVIDADFQFEYLMLYVGQSYAYSCDGKFREALDSLQRGEDRLNEVSLTHPDTTSYGRAFLHVTRSMKAFLSVLNEDFDDASRIMTTIPAISEMDEENLAALQGLRGLFYGEYGFEGFRLAVQFLSKAIEMDPEESSWNFFKGKYLSRLRHVERPQDVPNEEEMHHLELASKLKKNGSYSLFLAQMYNEMAKSYHKRLRNLSGLSRDEREKEKRKCDELNKKSCELYIECLRLKPDCAQSLFRCAKGFMRLPYPWRDEKEAKRLLEEGLKLNPCSGFGHHSMAQYYERSEKNPQKAIEHLKICQTQKIFPAIMDLLRLEYQICGATDTVQRLETLLSEFKEIIQKSQILVLLSSHHLLVLNDLRKACQYAEEIKRLNGTYDYLKKQHQPFLVRGSAQQFWPMINLYEVLMDEILISLQEPTCTSDDKEYFEPIFRELSSTGGNISLDQSPRFLKKKIIADTEKPISTSTSRGDTTTRNKREDQNRGGSSFRGRRAPESSSRPKTYAERKYRPPPAKSSSGDSTKQNTAEPPNSKDEETTNRGKQENRHDSGDDEEIVKSMRELKTQDSKSSSKNSARTQKASSPDPLMMALMDKYS